MKHPPPFPKAFGPYISRFADVMAHTDRYAFRGVAKLAMDSGVSPSSVSRILNGKMNPSFLMVARLAAAIERTCGHRIDPRDLLAEDGRFLTPFACDVVGCRGCLPDNAYDEFGSLKPAFAGIKPGQWVASRAPGGLLSLPPKEEHE